MSVGMHEPDYESGSCLALLAQFQPYVANQNWRFQTFFPIYQVQ